jgi:uncharacterized phage protein (TIGR01671 family)
MNDRFKFRCWGKVDNKMVTTPLVLHSSGAVEYPQGGWDVSGYDDSDHFTLMQSTGLKDKNKKLVYEGDIIFMNGKKYIVVNYFGAFGLELPNGDFFEYFCNWSSIDCGEIIGNKFKNPELLDKKDD